MSIIAVVISLPGSLLYAVRVISLGNLKKKILKKFVSLYARDD